MSLESYFVFDIQRTKVCMYYKSKLLNILLVFTDMLIEYMFMWIQLVTNWYSYQWMWTTKRFKKSAKTKKEKKATKKNNSFPLWRSTSRLKVNIKANLTRQSKGRLYPQPLFFCKHFVFLSTWLVRWTWPKLYTTTGQEWENRKYNLFDLVWPWPFMYGSRSRSMHIVSMRTTFVPS